MNGGARVLLIFAILNWLLMAIFFLSPDREVRCHPVPQEAVLGNRNEPTRSFSTVAPNVMSHSPSCFINTQIPSKQKLGLAVLVVASVVRPCLDLTLKSLQKFYNDDQIFIYHSNYSLGRLYSNFHHLLRQERDSHHQSPSLSSVFSDRPHRIEWRSSIVYDYAMALQMMANRSDILITSEDDVEHWFSLATITPPFSAYAGLSRPKCRSSETYQNEMARYEGSGALSYVLNNTDSVMSLSHYLLSFWDVKPIDHLVADFFQTKSRFQRQPAMHRFECSLVQHVGCVSTRLIGVNNLTTDTKNEESVDYSPRKSPSPFRDFGDDFPDET